MPEGTLKNWDGLTVKVNRDVEGLDLNRNFPPTGARSSSRWAPAPPTSEPEVRAMVDFVIAPQHRRGHQPHAQRRDPAGPWAPAATTT